MTNTITVGYPTGYWGDEFEAPQRLIRAMPDVDYLGMDYLAEITMAILKRQQERDSSLGYARSFPPLIERILEDLVENDIKLLANAGGVNPESCQKKVGEIAEDAGFDVSVAAVTGDDILERIPALREEGISFDNVDTGDSFAAIEDDLVAANAYIGAFPLARALNEGADIVITGRCVDAATAMAPMIHEFDWAADEYDRLAGGLIAGHLLECGTQVTGGNLLDGWQDVDFHEMGYPVAEVEPDGDFVVTKPEDTGGEVTELTVKQQLVYEIKDPERYRVPDVTADFTSPELDSVGEDRVAVTGATGDAPPDTLKVTALYEDGYKTQLLLIYSWPDALEKARTADSVIRARTEDVGLDEIRTEFLGFNGCHDGISVEPADPNEIVLRMAVRADDKGTITEFGRRAIPITVSGPPNVSPVVSGIPEAQSILSFWPCTVPERVVDPSATIERSRGER
jgi:hypothetical protein